MFETPDDVLEHFGVKGQRWGVRNKRTSGSRSKSGRSEKVSEERKKLLKRSATVAVVAGVVIAGAIVAHRSGVRLPSVRGSSSAVRGSASTARILRQIGNERFKAIPMPPVRAPRVGSPTANPLRVRAPRVGSPTANPLRVRAPRVGSPTAGPRRLRGPRLSSPGDLAAIRSSIASSVRDANAQLRTRDNSLNIPIHQRSYLTEWD